jgi:decaprenylphospho-beta-D-erythro-pentofuranosid-2-ulose 2-reductase
MKDALGAVQSALILGGDSDIAFATCKRLASKRLRSLVLAGRNLERLEERAEQLRQTAPQLSVRCIRLDALAFDQHAAFVDEAFTYGDIDLVLVAFGLLGDQQRDEHDARSAVDVIQTNFTGAVSLLIPIADRLVEQGHGTIVVLSTVAAERARRSNFIYGASKAGLDWFAQGLGDALHGKGVDVMIVRPGFATSKMTANLKTPPMATDPESVAAAIENGLRRRKEIVWAPGKLRWVMTVIRHLPRPVFRRIPL